VTLYFERKSANVTVFGSTYNGTELLIVERDVPLSPAQETRNVWWPAGGTDW